MMPSSPAVLLCACALLASSVSSFAPAAPSTHHALSSASSIPRTTALSMAGFGGAGPSKNKKKGAGLPKLKAKTQWDRYADMKTSTKVTVGVRIVGDDDAEWIEVGRVRSADDEFKEVAIARQRALIAEHGKRLYQVKIPAKAVLEWGMLNGEGEDATWVVVDKSAGDEAPKGIEKKIGFEGISDKASGFYCYYHEGRIVEKEESGMANRGGAFKAVKGK